MEVSFPLFLSLWLNGAPPYKCHCSCKTRKQIFVGEILVSAISQFMIERCVYVVPCSCKNTSKKCEWNVCFCCSSIYDGMMCISGSMQFLKRCTHFCMRIFSFVLFLDLWLNDVYKWFSIVVATQTVLCTMCRWSLRFCCFSIYDRMLCISCSM